MIDRLEEFIKNQGITIIEFERKISASDGVIRKSIRNKTDIQSKWLVRIAENYPILDMNWLLTGEGSMYRSSAVMSEASPPDRDEVVRLLRPAEDHPSVGRQGGNASRRRRCSGKYRFRPLKVHVAPPVFLRLQ